MTLRSLPSQSRAGLRARRSSKRTRDGLLGLLVADVEDYAIFVLDIEGNVLSWNAGAERFKGYRADEIIGRHFSVFYPPEDVAAGKPERELVIAAASGRLEDEGWRVRKDGTRFWANVTITALRDGDGILQGYGKVTRDLTERRRGEVALRTAEERFRRTFDDAPVGMAIVAATPGPPGRFVDVNKAMCDLTGYDRAGLLMMSLGSLTAATDLDGDAETIVQILTGQVDRAAFETRYISAMGDAIDVSVGLSLIRDSDGCPLHVIASVSDVSSRKRYEGQLRYMADHDPLTGLPNRAQMDEAIDAQVARVRRYPPTGALLMIDVDRFKQINDGLGHAAGDRILVEIARILRGRVRETDVLARLGGDEFAILMTDGREPEAQALASDLSDLVRRRATVEAGGEPGGITISIGIAVFDDRENLNGANVLSDADTALYSAKADGRDRIAAYVIEDGARHQRAARLTMHHQIATALEDDRFQLLLQPVVNLRTGEVGKYEALLRMITKDGKAIAPGAFLYVAERFDQIAAIDRWVIEHAIALLAEIPQSRALEINLSGRSLGDPALAAHIGMVIAASGADPGRLIFEITETAAIENIHRAQEFVDELSSLGCRFALDDFGAGFGSFYYLKYLSSDYLKIDGEFVRHCTESRTDQIVIQALVQLARGLGKETIAEFVENADILRLVRALGVDHAQGYEIARPQPIEQLLQHQPYLLTPDPAGNPDSTRSNNVV